MNPLVLFSGFGLFFFCLAVHIIIWRIRLPWVSSLVLFFIFLGMPAAIGLVLLADIGGCFTAAGLTVTEILGTALLHIALSGVYIASYPAARAISPSLDIIQLITRSKDKKMTREELRRRFTGLRLVTARVDDLRDYRLIAERDSRFVLLPAAKVIVVLFTFYRRLLGLPMGGG